MGRDTISVVFFRTAYGTMGGGTKMLLRLLEGLDKDRFNVTLASQRWDELCDRTSKLDVDIEIIPFPGVLDTYDGKLLEMPSHRQAAAGARLLQYNWRFGQRIGTPDIVWCGGTRPFVTLIPYLRLSNVVSIWNVGLLHESTGTMSWINDLCLRNADHIFIESDNQARRQLTEKQYRRFERKATMFHKGIDVQRFDPRGVEAKTQGEGYRVGTAALINPRKGLEHFIDAAAEVLNERPDIHFTIAGEIAREDDKTYRKTLEKRIQEHGIDESVEFLGWVEDMPEYLHTLDVFVLPSLNEGIPGAVREALAMGVPAVASDVGGIPDVVIEGETGFLVEPGDAGAIAEAVSYLLDNPTDRCEMGEQGRDHIVNRFSIQSYVENYENFLETVHKE